ncbi:MAG: AAA family ATPase [Hymenobacter sp.]
MLIGPNGSGKSTVLDALDFLAEAVRGRLTQAWEERGRFRGIQTRGGGGNIEFEVRFASAKNEIAYYLSIEEGSNLVKISDELLSTSDGENTQRIFYKVLGEGKHRASRHINDYASDAESDYQSTVRDDFSHLSILQKSPWHAISANTTLVANAILSYRLFHLTDDHLKGYSRRRAARRACRPTATTCPTCFTTCTSGTPKP